MINDHLNKVIVVESFKNVVSVLTLISIVCVLNNENIAAYILVYVKLRMKMGNMPKTQQSDKTAGGHQWVFNAERKSRTRRCMARRYYIYSISRYLI